MRLDHMAYRTRDRNKTAEFLMKSFDYRIDPELPEGFDVEFDNGTSAKCLVLLPPEKKTDELIWAHPLEIPAPGQVYHLAPEIFISDGESGSIIGDWVAKMNAGLGGLHHLAYQVESVADIMEQMITLGLAEFTTREPITCEGLQQAFTKPSPYTGIIYEFISRGKQGFCQSSVKYLMQSTKDFS